MPQMPQLPADPVDRVVRVILTVVNLISWYRVVKALFVDLPYGRDDNGTRGDGVGSYRQDGGTTNDGGFSREDGFTISNDDGYESVATATTVTSLGPNTNIDVTVELKKKRDSRQ